MINIISCLYGAEKICWLLLLLLISKVMIMIYISDSVFFLPH